MNALTINQQNTSLMDFSSYKSAMYWAKVISESDLCPKDCKGKIGDILIRIEFGQRLGLSPMQALTNIATINGRPSLWGDALMSLCRRSKVCEYITESFDEQTMTATCVVKRKGEPEQSRSFSQKDAEQAGLWRKAGPWTQYPKRMLQMRARSWALRDVFGDLLGSVSMAEEAQDMQVTEPSPPRPQKVFESTEEFVLETFGLKDKPLQKESSIVEDDEEMPREQHLSF